MRRLLPALGAFALAADQAPAANPVPAADPLVERLASPRFADRADAARALAKLGAAALPALDRLAVSGSDPDARAKAADLAARIRREGESADFVAVKPVELRFDNKPLAAAVAAVKELTGVPLVLDPTGVRDAFRPVTVATPGPVPPWQAVELLCRAAGLREVVRPDVSPSAATVGDLQKRVAYSMAEVPTVPAWALPVTLADGGSELPAADHRTAVRVAALPPGFPGNRVVRGAGEVLLHLDVTPLPRLNWQDVESVRVTRAVDADGRPLATAHGGGGGGGMFGGAADQQVWIGGGIAWAANVDGSGQPTRSNPRVVAVRLRTDDRPIDRLRLLEGVAVGVVVQPNQTLLALDDLTKASGRTFDVGPEAHLAVTGYDARPDGSVTVRLRADYPNPWSAQRLGFRRAGGFAGVMAPPGFDGTGIMLGSLAQVKFLSADGKPVATPGTSSTSMSDNGIRQTYDVELTFPKGTAGRPTRLVATGNKTLRVEVPFRLENVRLP